MTMSNLQYQNLRPSENAIVKRCTAGENCHLGTLESSGASEVTAG
jgi:hypothetical protein